MGAAGDGPPLALSIVIPTYDRYDDLAGAVASVEVQSLSAEAFELIVVDNGPDALAREDFLASPAGGCRMRFLVEPRPGVSRARNLGVAHARGTCVAFLDDDALADPDWARVIVERFAQDPRIGALGGPVVPLWPSEPPAWLHREMLGLLSCVDHGSTARALLAHEWMAGANIAYRRDALLAAGGFDEGLGRVGRMLLSNEEVALTQALERAGFLAFYDPAMRVRHHVHPERLSQKWVRERWAWQVVSAFLANPDASPPERSRDIDTVRGFLDRLPPRDRGPQGLFVAIAEPDVAIHQLAAVGAIMRLLLRNAGDWRTIVDLDGLGQA